MGIRKVQTSFAAGELSPAMYGRFDDKKYQQGLARCRNFIVLPQGPVTIRPGTAFVNRAGNMGKAVRLIPFTFASDQTMVLEFGDRYIRFHTNGQTLMGGDGQPYQISTPYAAEDLFEIHYCQSMDVMTLVHTAYAPMELARYGATDWRLTQISFGEPLPPPSTPSVSFHVVAPHGTTINDDEKTRYDLKYRVTAVAKTDLGDREGPPSPTGQTKGNLYLSNATATISWGSVSGADRYRVYKNYQGLYCYIGETEETNFVDDNYEPDAGITPPKFDDPFKQNRAITKVTVTNGGSGFGRDSVLYEPWMTSRNTGSIWYGYLRWNHGDAKAWIRKEIDPRMFNYPQSPSDQRARELIAQGVPCYKKDDLDIIKVLLIDGRNNRNGSIEPGGPGKDGSVSYTTYEWGGYVFFDSFTITNGGYGYAEPRISITYYYKDWGYGKYYRHGTQFDLKVASLPMLRVSDSTGRGADLQASVTDGRISSVNVVYGGYGYSNPTVSVVGGNRGATFSVEVSTGGDFPGAVCYYEQRRCFGGTKTRPQNVWMTRSGTESDMSYTIPSKADNRLKFQIAAYEASQIEHLVPLSQMIALTNSTEYRVEASAPDSIDSKMQAQIGASPVQPVVVNSTLVYAAARGGHLRELGYNWQSSGFTTGDLSLRSEHIFETARIKDMALMKSPDPIIWCAMSDGKLAGITYLPEQAVNSWHVHEFEGAEVESVACVQEGEEDVLYLVMNRVVGENRYRYIERMKERAFESLDRSWHVDCGGVYDGAVTTEVSGLDWLEGETVSILANGCVLPQRVVTGGKVTLTQPSSYVIVGVPITADLQSLPVALNLQDGSYGTGHSKNVNDVFCRVIDSSGVFIGPDFENLVEYKQRTDEPYGTPPKLMTKEISVATVSQWNDSGQICLRQKDPLPLTLASISWDLAQ